MTQKGQSRDFDFALVSGISGANIRALGINPTHESFDRIQTLEVAVLVLKRRKGEEIIINDEIRIVVSQTSDGSCSLAIEAPESYRIRRAELPDFQESIIQQTASAWRVE